MISFHLTRKSHVSLVEYIKEVLGKKGVVLASIVNDTVVACMMAIII